MVPIMAPQFMPPLSAKATAINQNAALNLTKIPDKYTYTDGQQIT